MRVRLFCLACKVRGWPLLAVGKRIPNRTIDILYAVLPDLPRVGRPGQALIHARGDMEATCNMQDIVQLETSPDARNYSLEASERNAHTRFSYTTNVVQVPGNMRKALVPRPL
jgi:hypothetical protein